MSTPHPYANHPDVGKRSLAGTIITPDDVARAEEEIAADAMMRAQLDDERDGDAVDYYDGSPI